MSPHDTTPAPPPPPGVDVDLVEAFAADIATLADSAEVLADTLRGLVASMRREAMQARGK